REGVAGEFGGPGLDRAVGLCDLGGGVDAVVATEDAPGRIRLGPLALAGHDRVDQKPVGAHHADSAAPHAGRARLFAELVALGAHRVAPFELLDRVVARVGDQAVNRVQAVLVV